MMLIRKTATILCFLLISCAVYGQTTQAQRLQMLSQALPVAPQKPVQYASAQNNQTEFQLIFAGLFLAYKNFISSQDFQRCQFQPSCSEYGMIAVKQKGILIGMLSTFDRLLRCNSLPTRFYPINPQGNAWLDPVE